MKCPECGTQRSHKSLPTCWRLDESLPCRRDPVPEPLGVPRLERASDWARQRWGLLSDPPGTTTEVSSSVEANGGSPERP